MNSTFVRVYIAGINAGWITPDNTECIRELLPSDFTKWRVTRQLSYYTGRLILSRALKEIYGIGELCEGDIAAGEHGKPYFTDAFYLRWCLNERVYFNISHSRDLLCLSISNRETDVDIEAGRERKVMHELAEKHYSREEMYLLQELVTGNTTDKAVYISRFYNFWTARETLVKYGGRGLAGMGHLDFKKPSSEELRVCCSVLFPEKKTEKTDLLVPFITFKDISGFSGVESLLISSHDTGVRLDPGTVPTFNLYAGGEKYSLSFTVPFKTLPENIAVINGNQLLAAGSDDDGSGEKDRNLDTGASEYTVTVCSAEACSSGGENDVLHGDGSGYSGGAGDYKLVPALLHCIPE